MDWTEWKQTFPTILKKYRWAAVVLLVGLVMMAFPDSKEVPMPAAAEISQMEETGLQQELETLLSKLDGAGKVKVLLTVDTGERTHYQTDEDQQRSEGHSDLREETVIITDNLRSQQGLVQQVDPPVYRGAVVLCQGGDRASVRLAVVDAVKTATGLTADKITVLKMK